MICSPALLRLSKRRRCTDYYVEGFSYPHSTQIVPVFRLPQSGQNQVSSDSSVPGGSSSEDWFWPNGAKEPSDGNGEVSTGASFGLCSAQAALRMLSISSNAA